MNRRFILATVFLALALSGCGYRFVDPFPASDYTLLSVRNATAEPSIAGILEEELRRLGGFVKGSRNLLSVSITEFSEEVESISSAGVPVRQALTMEVAWKVEGAHREEARSGSVTARRGYPYSDDPTALEWNRNAAVRLLVESAAGSVLDQLGVWP